MMKMPTKIESNWKFFRPLEKKIIEHMLKAGHITALDAMVNYGITSASLTRRICDLEEMGIQINRERRVHPVTGRKYTRYSLFYQDRMPALKLMWAEQGMIKAAA